ncbi:uncharacterized protein FIBRA_00564 [Fibroporia radiculosa]|uniref:Phospholipase C/P1 nuclease n=1 Tax=Fibroporia radiculosa TaxID=599839 RepID=J4H087_9APHY|nr:uncharacterized protein FIBRA_00564 [Fibroporia radiculosa]CCL98564.1 predicted protein [Fibroporia radiculosa]
MKAHLSVAFAVSLAVASLPGALGWGAAGHEIVATIAQIHLHPAVLPVLCDILHPGSSSSSAGPPCHLAPIAAWADRVRGSPAYRWTAPLHYVGAIDDSPGDACEFPGPRGWAGRHNINVLAAVGNKTAVLAEALSGERSITDGEVALKFLVHFVGDMHMPLHLTGKERGGNGAKVTFDGRVTNLHSVWDGLLIAQALRTIPANYSRPLADAPGVEAHLRGTIYDSYIRRIMHEGFGVGAGASTGAGRFDGVDEWLSCPADEAPEVASPGGLLSAVFQSIQNVLGLGRRDDAIIEKRHQAMRPKFPDGTHVSNAKRSWGSFRSTIGDEKQWDDGVLCPYAWAREIHELNCALPVWPAELSVQHSSGAADPELDSHSGCAHDDDVGAAMAGRPRPHPDLLELDTPAYAGHIRAQWVVERLLAMAGIRLAGILNGLVLGGDPDDEMLANVYPRL